MSTEVAGTPTYHATVTFPDDGDPRNATTLGAALQDLTDRTAALHDKPSGDTSTIGAGATQNVAGTLEIADGGILGVSDGGRILLRDGAQLELHGNVTVSASATIDEEALAVVNEGATYTQTGPRYLSGAGRIQQRVVVGPDAGANYDGSVADVVIIPAATLSADQTYVLNVGATRHGQRITFINYTTNYGILFSSAGTIYRPVDYNPALLLRSASGYVSWVEFMYSDGESGHPPIGWHVIQYRVIP